MTVLFIFCHQNELKDWIVDLCNLKDLGILCLGNANTWEIVSSNALVVDDVGYQFFLFPHRASVPAGLSMNDVRPRDWGWITVRPGGVKDIETKVVLLSSEIHGETCNSDDADPEKVVQWFKKNLKPWVYHGVRGRNVLTQGESEYDNIWYTRKAKELFNAGVIWKQFPSDNSIFEPLGSD